MNIYCIANLFTYFCSKKVQQTSEGDQQQRSYSDLQLRNDGDLQHTSDSDPQQRSDGGLPHLNDGDLQQRNDSDLQQSSDGDLQQSSDGDLQPEDNNYLRQSSVSFTHERAPDPECRIINVQLLSRHIEDVAQHVATCSACHMVAQSLDAITVVGEKDRNGLASIMGCKFKGCGQELTFNTSTKATGLTGKHFWTNNLAAVWGQMSVGGGFNSLEESLSVFNIPVMTQRSFVHTEQMIGKW